MDSEGTMKYIEELLGVGTEEYFINGFHLSKVIEHLGGIRAFDSHNFLESVNGLVDLGWDIDRIKQAICKEFDLEEVTDACTQR